MRHLPALSSDSSSSSAPNAVVFRSGDLCACTGCTGAMRGRLTTFLSREGSTNLRCRSCLVDRDALTARRWADPWVAIFFFFFFFYDTARARRALITDQGSRLKAWTGVTRPALSVMDVMRIGDVELRTGATVLLPALVVDLNQPRHLGDRCFCS